MSCVGIAEMVCQSSAAVLKGFVRQMFTVGYFYLTRALLALVPRGSVMPGFGNESMEI